MRLREQRTGETQAKDAYGPSVAEGLLDDWQKENPPALLLFLSPLVLLRISGLASKKFLFLV